MGILQDIDWAFWTGCVAVVLIGGPLLLQVGLLYVWAPFKVYRGGSMPARAKPKVVDVPKLPPALQQVIESITRRFARAGFACEGAFRYEEMDAATEMAGIQVNFLNRETGELGGLILVSGQSAQNRTLGVRTRLASGRWINTMGWQVTGVLPPDPNVDSAWARWVRDPVTLVEFHRRRVAAAGQPVVHELPYRDGELPAYLEHEFELDVRRFEQAGYARLDPADGRYHYTLRGAWCSVIKLLRPMRSILARRAERKARLAWWATGMDGFTVPADTVPHATALDAGRGSALDYSSTLPQGEMTVERRGPALIIRMGNAAMGQLLRRQWFNFLSTGAWLAMIAFGLRYWWKGMQIGATLPPGVMPTPRLPWLFYVACVLVILDTWQIYRALMKFRGTTTLTVGPAGIEYHNAPGTPRDGRVLREDVFSLMVHLSEAGIRRRVHRLVVVSSENQQKIALLDGPDKNELERVKTSIREALQLESPADQPPAPPA